MAGSRNECSISRRALRMLRIRKDLDNIKVFASRYVTQRERVTYESSDR